MDFTVSAINPSEAVALNTTSQIAYWRQRLVALQRQLASAQASVSTTPDAAQQVQLLSQQINQAQGEIAQLQQQQAAQKLAHQAQATTASPKARSAAQAAPHDGHGDEVLGAYVDELA
jgi:TolA-binding protein